MTELILGCLNAFWEILRNYLAEQIQHRTMLGRLLVLVALAAVAYLALLWVCLSYIGFPVSPYGLSDLVEWMILAGSIVWGGIGLYFGGAMLLALLWLLLVVAVHFLVSFGYVCHAVWNGRLRQSSWLKRYRPIMIFGMTASLAVATYAEGGYRFWEPPLSTFRWIEFAAVGVSAWAALFCQLMRGNVRQRGTPRRIIKWTIGLTVAIALLIHWLGGQNRTAHIREKEVIEHPNDPAKWLDLARYYQDEGDTLAADSGDEDHTPPDPKPYYEEALDCMNRAVELGAAGFDVNFSRAQLADSLGQTRAAISFAEEALKFAPGVSTPEGKDQVAWLNDMLSRNVSALTALQQEEQREHELKRVRNGRRQRLPRCVRWVFDPEN